MIIKRIRSALAAGIVLTMSVMVSGAASAQTKIKPPEHGPRGQSRAGVFEYVFPAIRGVQAGREYYVTMCPLRLIPRLFVFDEEELPPEMRAQRSLNKARVPEMARYMVDNPHSYVFSALTASINAVVQFDVRH
jgi:DNA sulfur modification protein DndB